MSSRGAFGLQKPRGYLSIVDIYFRRLQKVMHARSQVGAADLSHRAPFVPPEATEIPRKRVFLCPRYPLAKKSTLTTQ